MGKTISKLLILTFVLLSIGCASGYKPIKPPLFNYDSHDLKDGLLLSYKYDVLRERGNKKYAKKEFKKGVKLIAVKLTNNTESIVNIGQDVIFYSGQNQIVPMDPIAIREELRQNAPFYILYLLLIPVKLVISDGTTVEAYPVGYVLGPVISIGNIINAGSANVNLLKELNQYNILNRELQPGEIIYGIMGIRDMDYNPITLEVKNQNPQGTLGQE